MTDLYTVSIDSVACTTLRGRVHIINPDAAYVPKGATFPVSLLFETWFPKDEDAPSAASVGECDPFVVAQRPELESLILGRREIRVSKDGFLLADDGRTLLEPRRRAEDVLGRRGGNGHDGISDYFNVEVAEEDFVRRASSIVTSYEVSPLRNVPLWTEVAAARTNRLSLEERAEMASWEGEADLTEGKGVWPLLMTRPFEKRPYADITVTVSDARYLTHMTPGLRFRTTSWR